MAWLANLASIALRSRRTEEPLALCCPRSCNGTSFCPRRRMARYNPQTCRVLLPTSAVLQEVRARFGSATCTGAHGNLGGATTAEVQPASHGSDRQGRQRARFQSSHVHVPDPARTAVSTLLVHQPHRSCKSLRDAAGDSLGPKSGFRCHERRG